MIPIKQCSKFLQLFFPKVFSRLFNQFLRMLLYFNRVIFRMNTKSIKTHWLKNIKSSHFFKSTKGIRSPKGINMTDMKTFPGWIRKHHQIKEGFLCFLNINLEGFIFFPLLLPLLLNFLRVISSHVFSFEQRLDPSPDSISFGLYLFIR